MKWLILISAIALAVGRFFIPSHSLSAAGSYEAFAHLFVGGLIGAWLAKRDRRLLWIAVAMSAVEIVAFATRGMR